MLVQDLVRRALKRPSVSHSGLIAPPMLSGALPVVGHTAEFVRTTIGLLSRAQQENGEIASLQVAHKKMVAVFGPEANEAVFRAPDEQLSPSEAYKIMTPVFGKDIVYDAPPERMNEQLKMLQPALRDRRMRTYGESILEEVNQSIEDWGDEGEIDLVDYCRVLTNFTSSRCLLGPEFRSGMTDEFARVYHDLERGVTPIAYLNAHLPIPSFIKRDRARVRLVEMISKIIDERRRSGRRGEDFLQTLMDSRYKNGAHLSGHEITGMLLAAMFAGHHTSSVTTAWALLELLRNRVYFDRVVQQLDTTFGAGDGVTYQALRDITETENVVKEALRLHPPLFMLVRVAMQDFQYKHYMIPEGTWVLISPTVSHQIPEYFKNPMRFDPDRFAEPRREDRQDFAYIPFGGGRHKCLGNAFALLQVKAILAVLLRRYNFDLVGDRIDSDFHGLVVGPAEPCRVRYHLRERPAQVQVPEALQPKAEAPAAAGRPFRVILDRDLCQAHSVCINEAPEIFRVGSGKVELLQERPDPKFYAQVKQAAQYCPNRVISVVEEEPERAAPSGCPMH